ncbi:MAG TPA: hypothetical protein PKD56_11955 [Chitinophagales bacterium]|nr:hypothetical protein [Chitinophagales bacterium]
MTTFAYVANLIIPDKPCLSLYPDKIKINTFTACFNPNLTIWNYN